jgi:hypothetical protein
MRKAIIEEQQSIYDVAIQEYGTVEAVFLLLADNPGLLSSLDDHLNAGDVLEIQDDPEIITDKDVLAFFRNGGIRVLNGEIALDVDFNDDFNNDFIPILLELQ